MTLQPRQRVLYVNDQADNHELLKLILPELEITCAQALEDGMLLAGSEDFALYILDLRLQDSTAMDLCKFIRALDPASPIILCSADVRDAVRRQALESGAQVFITIPMDFDHLRAEVGRLLQP